MTSFFRRIIFALRGAKNSWQRPTEGKSLSVVLPVKAPESYEK
jgi:hypothetical protein